MQNTIMSKPPYNISFPRSIFIIVIASFLFHSAGKCPTTIRDPHVWLDRYRGVGDISEILGVSSWISWRRHGGLRRVSIR